MKINLADIKHTPHETVEFSLAERLDPALYGYGEFTLPQPVSCQGRVIERSPGTFWAEGAYQCTAELICSRCGRVFSWPVTGSFTALFATLPAADWDGETNTFPLEGDAADLGEALAGEIYFSLPMQPLCRENCQGLCPVCGADLNEQSCSCRRDDMDPRWEKLKNLRFDD